ncbi:MAG: hypothetical protein HYU78_17185 [Rhodocyclales bacterium]|nr:hypothetical protein [Rhodocyclales bacterium]
MHTQLIHLHRAAPAKPAKRTSCNGCGVCCAAETCPAGMIIFRQRRGPCPALAWHGDEDGGRYRCGLLTSPASHVRWLPYAGEGLARTLFARWIAAGTGCDSDAEVG